MKLNTIFFAGLLVLLLSGCNNSSESKEAAQVMTAEDSAAFEVKVTSEDLQQQAEELDQEVDSLVNSLN
ncbi:MAG: hypothetical protein V4615_14615 [Bacteroidota bacterium]